MREKNYCLRSCLILTLLLISIAAIGTALPPVADFEADPLEGCKDLTVAFTDLSDNAGSAITSWLWSFGDGATSTTQNPIYTYTIEGNYDVSLTVINADGQNTETKTDYIHVGPPIADFHSSPQPAVGCLPFTVNFYNDVEGYYSLIYWDFGDGTVSYQKNPVHTYTKPGIFAVSVTVWGCGETNTRTKTGFVTAYQTVDPDFTVDKTQVCVGEPVHFTDNSINDPITWEWDFGDGQTSNQTNPTHVYDMPGLYTVSLYAENYNGCGDLIIKPDLIYVQETAYPAFEAEPTSGCESIVVNFTNQSEGEILSYLWDFGDGTTSTLENPPPHTYGLGSYTVTLTTEADPLCGYTSETREQYINVYQSIEAAFEAEPTTTCFNYGQQEFFEVFFTDLSTGDIDSWYWEFGDGDSSTEQNPSHIYYLPGKYTVSLTVTGPCGSDIETKTEYIQLLVPPLAYFYFDPYVACEGDEVTFMDFSSGDIDTWLWDFGDGTTSTLSNPTHVYQAGTYYPSLHVEGPCGEDTSVAYDPVIVYEYPMADFTVDHTDGCLGEPFQFTDLSTGDIDSWWWNFGDGETGSMQNPSHTYDEPGIYTVSLSVTGFCSSDTLTMENLIRVDYPIDIDFDAFPTTGCETLEVQFNTILTSGTMIDSVEWDFGDNILSQELNPTHVYGPGEYNVYLWAWNPCGEDIEYKESFIKVFENVSAMFSAEPTSGCMVIGQGFPVSFNDMSTGSIDSWHWDFGDGQTSSEPNPIHNYSEGGVYTVSLTVSGPCGEDTFTRTDYITVLVPPTARFTASPNYGCNEETFQFTDLSTGDIDSWLWDFGDNTISNLQNPTHTYGPGSYTVTLTVTGPCGEDTETRTNFINVYVSPTADFEISMQDACIGEWVQFTDYSSGDISSWSWDFGDGHSSMMQNPSHAYDMPGTYTVSLMVSGICGQDTMVITDAVRVDYPLDIDFEAEPTSGCETLTVQFNTLLTSGTVVDNVLWRFGDGETSEELNPMHTFGPGVYDVSLEASGICGDDAEYKQGYIRVYENVMAMFDAEPTSGCLVVGQGFPVIFRDLSIGSIEEWRWDFGDGQTSTEQNPIHNYGEEGVYTVSLTVRGPCGEDTMTITDYITVYEPPFADFTNFPSGACDSATINFYNHSTGTITDYHWDFGDGTTSDEENPVHTFSVGTFTVSLTVTGPCGEDTYTRQDLITVFESPVAEFRGAPTTWCTPMDVSFMDLSTGDIDYWYWDFGDGNTSMEPNPTHTYDEPGTYTVSLMVESFICGSDTEIKHDYIIADYPLGADFDAFPREGCDVMTVDFEDLSTGTVQSWVWDFGDNTTSTLQHPTHTYMEPGVYTVGLSIMGLCGEDSEYKQEFITVYESPVADFMGDPLTGCDSLTVQFTDLSTGDISSWWWNFGDGNTSQEPSPEHTYTAPGVYTVTLNVSGQCGEDVEIKEAYIVVFETPEAMFSAWPTSGCETLEVYFEDMSTGDIESWMWDFGDNTISTEQNPVHTYQQPGLYTVTLSVSGPCGESSYTGEDLIRVYAPPQADFESVTIGSDCDQGIVQFVDLSLGDEISTRTWDFGDGTTSHDLNPLHYYMEPGRYNVTLTIESLCGIDSITKVNEVVVYSSTPVADFHEYPTSGCEPLLVQFMDDSTGVPTEWYWDFGDGTVSRKQNPLHLYDGPGIYSVKLYIKNPCGSDIIFRPLEVIVYEAANADFEADVTQGCESLMVQFNSFSEEDEDTFLWDFGDGTTSTERHPMHEYTGPGMYTVSLEVTTKHDCFSMEVKEHYIIVGAPIEPDFRAMPLEGCAPLTVDFEDLSTGTVLSWLWDFGNGDTSMEQNPSYTYIEAGTYSVSLLLEGPCGEVQVTMTDYITVNEAPTADFDASPTCGCAPLTVNFTDMSQGTITSWHWDFGDGGTCEESDPNYTYNEPGVYTVSLMVLGPCGTDTEIKEELIIVQDSPVANFMADQTEGCDELTVEFTDLSSGTITAWMWQFGTGDTSTEMNPVYTYTEPGIYTVTLKVTGPCGEDTFVWPDYITVLESPVADFTADPTMAYTGEPIFFENLSTGDIDSITWDFGDDSQETYTELDRTPPHIYDEPGTYTVSLTVTGLCGEDTKTMEDLISILRRPWVEITQPEGIRVGNIPVEYHIYDPKATPMNILVEYSDNSGTTWTLAMEGPGGDGMTGLTSSPGGTMHTFAWNSMMDLGAGSFDQVQIMITPSNASIIGDPGQTGDFEVFNPASMMVRMFLIGSDTAPGGNNYLYDVNHDGIVDAADVIMLIMFGL